MLVRLSIRKQPRLLAEDRGDGVVRRILCAVQGVPGNHPEWYMREDDGPKGPEKRLIFEDSVPLNLPDNRSQKQAGLAFKKGFGGFQSTLPFGVFMSLLQMLNLQLPPEPS